MRTVIRDFTEDLNYRHVILYIGNVNHSRLLDQLRKNKINKLYRFEKVSEDNLMYIKDCNLQDLAFDLMNYLELGYSVIPLCFDKYSGVYYVER